jgi:hypothetical protein
MKIAVFWDATRATRFNIPEDGIFLGVGHGPVYLILHLWHWAVCSSPLKNPTHWSPNDSSVFSGTVLTRDKQ